MRARASAAPLGVVAAVVGLSVLMAGCLAQDRPHEPSFTLIADAGGAVVAPGTAAHLEWPQEQAVEAEAHEGPSEPAEIEWDSSDGHHASGSAFSFTPGADFVLVQLNVTAENHSATDLGGVLVVPPGGANYRAYIGVIGEVELEHLGGPWASDTPVAWDGHKGHFYSASAVVQDIHLRVVQGPQGGEAAFIIGVRAPSNYNNVTMTPPIRFDAGVNYTLSLDTHDAGNHQVGIAGGDPASVPLFAFAESNGADADVRVVVAPEGQGLPGMDAAAAVVAFAALPALALFRRRR
jgi:hypothetical protein